MKVTRSTNLFMLPHCRVSAALYLNHSQPTTPFRAGEWVLRAKRQSRYLKVVF